MIRIKDRKRLKRVIRHKRVRFRITGAETRPRLSVFRSSKHIYAQLINDKEGKTLTAFSTLNLRPAKRKTKTKKDQGKKSLAFEVGFGLARKAQGLGVKKVVFDRSGYKFHGRLSELAKGAREGGLEF